MRGLGHVTYF